MVVPLHDLSIENFVMTFWEKKLTYIKILTSLNLVLLMTLKFTFVKIKLLTTVLLGSVGSQKEPKRYTRYGV